MSAVDRQLQAYLLFCAGIGAQFGAFGGIPGMFPGFFHPQLYFEGLLMAVAAGVWFAWEIRQ